MKPKWTPIKLRLGDMTPWGQNPRMSTKAQAQRIIESEKKFNQVIPFIVSPPHDNGKVLLYDGHQRLSAWLTIYGEDYQMDAMQSDRELTEAEHKELVITLHTGATGEWNWNELSSWSAPELKAWGMNEDTLKTWGGDYANLKGLIESEVPDFKPVGIDEQGRLDQKKPVTCPECGHEFTPK